MFNSYSAGGRATANSNNYLRINAISGTLVKNHPQSVFIIVDSKSPVFDAKSPRCVIAEAYQTTEWDNWPGAGRREYKVTRYRDVDVPVVVLQAMIIGDDKFLCEVVKTDDFFTSEEVTE